MLTWEFPGLVCLSLQWPCLLCNIAMWSALDRCDHWHYDPLVLIGGISLFILHLSWEWLPFLSIWGFGMVSCCMVLPCVPLHIPSAKLHLSPLGAYMLMVSLGWSVGIELPSSQCRSLLWCLAAAVRWTLCLGGRLVHAQIRVVIEVWPANAG